VLQGIRPITLVASPRHPGASNDRLVFRPDDEGIPTPIVTGPRLTSRSTLCDAVKPCCRPQATP
jgi:hypothetical protein